MNLLKKLLLALVVTASINFVGLVVATAMLATKVDLSREKLTEVKDVLFPPPAEPEPLEIVDDTPPKPTAMESLYALLDAQSGKPADERVDSVSREMDARLASVMREKRTLEDRLAQLARASGALAAERKAHAETVADWQRRVAAAADRAEDAGFAETLTLYEAMAARQVKDVFEGLDDEVALQFLRAMDPRKASKVLKEFEAGPETERVRRLLEMMRTGDLAAADPFAEPASSDAGELN